LNAEVGLFFWFQDADKKFINLSPTYNTEATVPATPSGSVFFYTNLINPHSRSTGLMSRLGINYNFERNISLHLRYQHFLTTANKHTGWGKIYNKELTIDLSYQFGKK
jgi:OmpA-like transmembrane domain